MYRCGIVDWSVSVTPRFSKLNKFISTVQGLAELGKTVESWTGQSFLNELDAIFDVVSDMPMNREERRKLVNDM